ncbi:hypothetical protein ACFMJX_01760 [Acinetobacter baumannii]
MQTDKKKFMITKTLPLTDIHRHLDGNIRIQTILELGQQYNLDLPAYDIESLRPHVQVMDNQPDLLSFLSKLDWGVKVLASLDACKRIAFENMQDAAQQGLDYVELRFSPGYMGMTHQLPLEGVPGVLQQIIEGAPLFSRIVGVGVCMQSDKIEPALAINKELEIQFVLGYTPLEFRDALHMIAEGKVNCSPLITGVVGLEGVTNAFEALRDPEQHAKILIDPKRSGSDIQLMSH